VCPFGPPEPAIIDVRMPPTHGSDGLDHLAVPADATVRLAAGSVLRLT
jgi:hypothetical protein